jgi:hypothetical protein
VIWPACIHWAELLAGETNAQLSLVNLQTNQAGLYSVSVSNTFGTVASAPARLLVFDACVGLHLYAGLSATGLVGRTYAIDYVTNLAPATGRPWPAIRSASPIGCSSTRTRRLIRKRFSGRDCCLEGKPRYRPACIPACQHGRMAYF